MRQLVSLISGAIFGLGLLISGMTNTEKVQGWLDVFGAWDPTLAFVMGGAIVPMAIAWQYSKKRSPVLAPSFPAPPKPEIGRNLIIGSTLFGMGWGLVGLCPGPAIASLSFGGVHGLSFVVAMIIGMLLAPKLRTHLDQRLRPS
ncbi:YeeE/YedE family protein [Loktanella sp. S4079]|uniref:YeeE/YedE family protein n=1 Tax=Loktanella sp. S4079 TaxID=579483 RepID=UPI0005FA58FF|nr:YeeE/YedE family protein [Loktanella sp. S4079]KJZ19866.1 membrane protein [Loktanella sp. S4079]